MTKELTCKLLQGMRVSNITQMGTSVAAAVIILVVAAATGARATGECTSIPCRNNGVCTEGAGDFTCACPAGFSGLYCQTDINECASTPCLSGGACVDYVGYYGCNCTANTFGPRCEISPCTTSPCSNGGTCVSATYNCSTVANPNSNAISARDNAAVMTWRSFAIFVGGGLTTSLYTRDASMIDTRDGNWYSLPDMAFPRSSSCGAAMPGTGMLFVAGGLNGTGNIQTVEYYNILTGSAWRHTAPMVGVLASTPTCAVAEDNFYVSRRSTADSSVNVWQYNGTTGDAGATILIGTFTSTPLMVAYGYKLYMGMNNFNLVVVDTRTLGTTTLTNVIPQQLGVGARYRFWAMSSSRLVMVRESFANQGNYLAKDVWTYDVVSGLGTASNKTYASREPCLAASDTSVFVVGGQTDGPASITGTTRVTSQFQTTTGAWTPGPNITTPIARCSMAYVAETRTYVVYGGITGVTPVEVRSRIVEMFVDPPPIRSVTTGACSPYRTCECAAGYQGASCQTDVDECVSSPCQNGGTCFDGTDRFTCTCVPGFSGLRCETGVDECSSTPCKFGGTCADGANGFTCTCAPGHSGLYCQTDVNECASTPCQFGGTCSDIANGFACACMPGYSGLRCQTDVSECASAPCANGGTCAEASIAAYTCACPPGFSGARCETDINECASTPCQHGAGCHDAVSAYSCTCESGFSGTQCQTDVDDCASSPCASGSTCRDLVNGWMCLCAPGYSGISCQTDINECASTPCANGGTCADTTGGYTCECSDGLDGTHCDDDINECATDNGGCGLSLECVNAFGEFSCEPLSSTGDGEGNTSSSTGGGARSSSSPSSSSSSSSTGSREDTRFEYTTADASNVVTIASVLSALGASFSVISAMNAAAAASVAFIPLI